MTADLSREAELAENRRERGVRLYLVVIFIVFVFALCRQNDNK
jgi:hypothetical protein